MPYCSSFHLLRAYIAYGKPSLASKCMPYRYSFSYKRAYCGDYTGYAESSFWFGNLDVWAILFLSEKMYDNP
ncbi:hypothetical protein bpr_III193 [Butyrivibrio proteoclasticus B316]|uniref:Uncharacterized protein n=1 Tax=Butyrivibrio proteoclasticus (strain ATCC 51982 / DSM 14932 / B316) TaxID=515622 RepID=E0S397_BUTPB|nr:hypothetical protein bpr_III193 [Butyrivibrio proteoclasticus B316]